MATIEELKRAMMKADEAGDTKAAAMLASKLKSMSSATPPEPEKQRIRAMGQGLTLGFADEAEAALRSAVAGEPYEATLGDIRQKLKSYQQAYPMSSVGYEALGALAPTGVALLASPFTGGTSGAAVAPTLGGLALRGAVAGGAYGYGTGEGDILSAERASRVPGGAGFGFVGGLVGGTVAKGIGAGFNKLVDVARRTIGGRGSAVLEREIQRLASQTGKSADQIADDIVNGRILAEDESIRAAVRAYRSGGGEASRVIERGMKPRPEETRKIAMAELRAGLSPSGTPGALAEQRASETVAKRAEKLAYEPFKNMLTSDETSLVLSDALKRVPGAAEEVTTALRARTGQSPFFKVVDGDVVFDRLPTVQEAEIIRRSIQNKASSLYSGGQGSAGEAVSEVERVLRRSLDDQVPDLASARLTASGIRSQRDAFEAGRKGLAGDVNENLINFSNMTDPQMVASYRAGLMSAIEAKGATGSKQSLIRDLANEESREGRLLREVFPQDTLDRVLEKLDIAKTSQAATDRVLLGSPTAETLIESGRRGMGISASDAVGVMNSDPGALLRVAQNLTSRFNRDLSESERKRVAEILVSTDPAMVRNAITDKSAMANLQKLTQSISAMVSKKAAKAGGVSVASPGAQTSQGLMVDVYPQPGLLGQ
jgi:hypothetical protein